MRHNHTHTTDGNEGRGIGYEFVMAAEAAEAEEEASQAAGGGGGEGRREIQAGHRRSFNLSLLGRTDGRPESLDWRETAFVYDVVQRRRRQRRPRSKYSLDKR